MKAVILAGGLGTRLSEETESRPKPMVEIGGKPLLWHLMKIYSAQGINDFIICLGYKGYLIKEYFMNYFLHQSDVTVDLGNNQIQLHDSKTEPWKVTLVDTGISTMTGGRLKKVQKYIGKETFMLTYGDGLADIDLKALLRFHRKHGKLATITAVEPPGRFGAMSVEKNSSVSAFIEKPKGSGSWINGGFFVLEPSVLKYIKDDSTLWEKEPLSGLASRGQLRAYTHKKFWKCMDTLRDKIELESLWNTENPPWKTWKD